MRNWRIGLLDIGLDASFDASMTFVQSVIQNVNAGYDDPIADVDFVRRATRSSRSRRHGPVLRPAHHGLR